MAEHLLQHFYEKPSLPVLKIPERTPAEIEFLLPRCWKRDPKDRPDMAQIVDTLSGGMSLVGSFTNIGGCSHIVPWLRSAWHDRRPMRYRCYLNFCCVGDDVPFRLGYSSPTRRGRMPQAHARSVIAVNRCPFSFTRGGRRVIS